MEENKTLGEIILDSIMAIILTIVLLIALSMMAKSIELEEKYIEETIKLQEEQIEILEKIEDKIY